jgi:hypothetical protein
MEIFGGMGVDDMEFASSFGISGMFSGWRAEGLEFPAVNMRPEYGGMSMKDWLDVRLTLGSGAKPGETRIEIDEATYRKVHAKNLPGWVKKLFQKPGLKEGDAGLTQGTTKKIDAKKDGDRYYLTGTALRRDALGELSGTALLREVTPLIESADAGIGLMLMQKFIKGKEGYQVRRALWQRTVMGRQWQAGLSEADVNEIVRQAIVGNSALDHRSGNVQLMVRYLQDVRMRRETPDAEKISNLEKIIKDDPGSETRPGVGVSGETYWGFMESQGPHAGQTRWEALEEKINLQHEVNMRRIVLSANPNPDIARQAQAIPDERFTDEEIRLIQRIKAEGLRMASQLADVSFPFCPFLNDAPIELFDYAKVGEEVYRRRTGDFASYFQASQAAAEIVKLPGGTSLEEAPKKLKVVVAGVEGPEGTTDAQERIQPLASTYVDWVRTKPGDRWLVKKTYKEATQTPTSLAQEYSGMEAPSNDEFQTRKLISDLNLAGVFNTELADKERKKQKVGGLLGLIWSLFRDYAQFVPVFLASEFGKRTMKTNPAG